MPPSTHGLETRASGAVTNDATTGDPADETGAGQGASAASNSDTTGTDPLSGTTCLAGAPTPGESARPVTVRRAVDGDTVELTDGTKVRLIGVNTPESVDPRRPVEYMGKEASAFTAQLLGGKEVILEPGRQPTDRYGRLLAWLWLPDGRFVNGLLVLEGYAQVATYADNPDHADLLRRCQREAQEAGRGLWADGAGADTADAGQSGTDPAAAGEAVSPGAAAPLSIVRQPGSVARGDVAQVTVQAPPGADCTITVSYRGGPSSAQGLEPKQAGTDGRLTWRWAVGSKTTLGTWPVTITCGAASVETTVTVL